jgi:hypothetical protein
VAEPLEPLVLKGKSEPVPVFRLVSVLVPPERMHATPFVGRERIARHRRSQASLSPGASRVHPRRLLAVVQ